MQPVATWKLFEGANRQTCNWQPATDNPATQQPSKLATQQTGIKPSKARDREENAVENSNQFNADRKLNKSNEQKTQNCASANASKNGGKLKKKQTLG